MLNEVCIFPIVVVVVVVIIIMMIMMMMMMMIKYPSRAALRAVPIAEAPHHHAQQVFRDPRFGLFEERDSGF